MPILSVTSRVLDRQELPGAIKDSFPLAKKVYLSEWAGLDKHILVHDGTHIKVQSGPGSAVGCGNSDYVMVCGSEKEVDVEIKKLNLTWEDTSSVPDIDNDVGIGDHRDIG